MYYCVCVDPASFEAVQPGDFEAVQPAGFEVGHFFHSICKLGQSVSKLVIRFRSGPAGFETGWVANRSVTYTVYKVIALRNHSKIM